jgi:hypothetical protein
MALIVIPTENGDSFISLIDANDIVSKNSIQASDWLALDDSVKEVYLRIATQRILDAVSTDLNNDDGYYDVTTYSPPNSCLPKTTALMAVHDLAYGLSSDINPNTGLITKEKVGDLEVNYTHGNPFSQISSKKTNPFPQSVVSCLNSYGASINTSSIKQVTLGKK